MKMAKVVLLVWAAVILAHSAQAQSQTFTQVGNWNCTVPAGSGVGFICPVVPFPIMFGGIPNIVTTGPAQPGNVSASGFTPVNQQPNPPLNIPIVGPQAVNLPISGTWVAVGPMLYTGTATPRYVVLTVIYAPPGTNGGHASSSVTYGAGVTSGTTTSASQSFQTSVGTTATTKAGLIGTGVEGSLSFDYTNKLTDNQSLEVKLSTNSSILRTGPAGDGINHDEDAIYLALKPTVDIRLSSTAAAWTFGDNGHTHIQFVFVGELNGHFQFRNGVLQELQAAGITPTDYPTILASDPLASASAQLDPARFVSVNTMFPYEPPPTLNDPVIPITTTISNSSTTTVGSAAQTTYKVSMALQGTAGFLNIAGGSFKDTSSWEWTNTSGTSTSVGTTQSASLTIGGPAFNYQGPTEVAVYLDTVYNTFAFVLVPPENLELAVRGTVVDKSGNLVPRTEVLLFENSITHRTFTNGKGEYKLFGDITGPVTVQAAGVRQTMSQSRSERAIPIRLPQ